MNKKWLLSGLIIASLCACGSVSAEVDATEGISVEEPSQADDSLGSAMPNADLATDEFDPTITPRTTTNTSTTGIATNAQTTTTTTTFENADTASDASLTEVDSEISSDGTATSDTTNAASSGTQSSDTTNSDSTGDTTGSSDGGSIAAGETIIPEADDVSGAFSDSESNATGSDHILDDTPRTNDGHIDSKYAFCGALFLFGLSLILFSKKKEEE
ncbi:MAG: hypothetical protein IJV04_04755 [Lachnospiraceae bacterium]|nr:hypothetical protein [Lachnospiraceae bacterium]